MRLLQIGFGVGFFRRDFGLDHRLRIRSLITSRHRLTLYAGEDWGELYDLQDDPLEQVNLWRDGARCEAA